jgi:hypothetical protein
MHPPESELGPKFFHLSEYSNTLKEEFDPIKAEYILVEGYEDYCADYKFIKGSIIHLRCTSNCRNLVTKGDGLVWSIDSFNNYKYEDLWRTHPDVVRLCKEHGWINKKFGGSRLRIATIPKGYRYSVTECDGMESLDINPPTAEVLQDLLERVKRSDYTPSNPFTEKLLKGELSVSQFLRPDCYLP